MNSSPQFEIKLEFGDALSELSPVNDQQLEVILQQVPVSGIEMERQSNVPPLDLCDSKVQLLDVPLTKSQSAFETMLSSEDSNNPGCKRQSIDAPPLNEISLEEVSDISSRLNSIQTSELECNSMERFSTALEQLKTPSSEARREAPKLENSSFQSEDLSLSSTVDTKENSEDAGEITLKHSLASCEPDSQAAITAFGPKYLECQSQQTPPNEDQVERQSIGTDFVAESERPMLPFPASDKCPSCFCVDCQQTLCGLCQIIHSNTTDSKEHHVRDSTEQLDMSEMAKNVIKIFVVCRKHFDRRLEIYCRTCRLRCCSSCSSEHNDHKYEKIIDLGRETRHILVKYVSIFEKVLPIVDKSLEPCSTDIGDDGKRKHQQPVTNMRPERKRNRRGRTDHLKKKANEPSIKTVETGFTNHTSGTPERKQEFQRKRESPFDVKNKDDTESNSKLELWRKYKLMWDNIILFCRVLIEFAPPEWLMGSDEILRLRLVELIGNLPDKQSAEVLQEYAEILQTGSNVQTGAFDLPGEYIFAH